MADDELTNNKKRPLDENPVTEEESGKNTKIKTHAYKKYVFAQCRVSLRRRRYRTCSSSTSRRRPT